MPAHKEFLFWLILEGEASDPDGAQRNRGAWRTGGPSTPKNQSAYPTKKHGGQNMKDGFIRAAAVTPKVKVADPEYNAQQII